MIEGVKWGYVCGDGQGGVVKVEKAGVRGER